MVGAKKAAKPQDAQQKPRKIAIVGAAPSSRDLAPYGDKDWEIWGCSPSFRDKTPRIDVWFELHSIAFLTSVRQKKWAGEVWDPISGDGHYLAWLREAKCKIFMHDNSLIPNAVPFPLDEVKAKVGGSFLTSSISIMLAYACYLHDQGEAIEVGIWGVDMTATSEYEYERPGCQYWIEKARDRGIKVFIPRESDLDIPCPVYGFDDAKPEATKAWVHTLEMMDRKTGIEQELGQIDARKAQLLHEHAFLSGAIEQATHMRRTFMAWSGPDTRYA